MSVTLKRAAATGPLPPYPQGIEAFDWVPPTPDDRWIVTVPEPATPTHGQSIADLREVMNEQARLTRTVLERLAEVDPRALTAKHPLIGEMNLANGVALPPTTCASICDKS